MTLQHPNPLFRVCASDPTRAFYARPHELALGLCTGRAHVRKNFAERYRFIDWYGGSHSNLIASEHSYDIAVEAAVWSDIQWPFDGLVEHIPEGSGGREIAAGSDGFNVMALLTIGRSRQFAPIHLPVENVRHANNSAGDLVIGGWPCELQHPIQVPRNPVHLLVPPEPGELQCRLLVFSKNLSPKRLAEVLSFSHGITSSNLCYGRPPSAETYTRWSYRPDLTPGVRSDGFESLPHLADVVGGIRNCLERAGVEDAFLRLDVQIGEPEELAPDTAIGYLIPSWFLAVLANSGVEISTNILFCTWR